MSTLQFARAHRNLLAFGFSLAFFSAFGQTFFIALFNADLRSAFGLSHGGLGTLYGLASLTAAALMFGIGPLIDRVDLRLYTGLAAAGLAAACLFMAAVPAGSLLALYLALAGLRFTGQGLMSHVSVTVMARSFTQGRGRALSLASLGFAGGEAVFPPLAVAVITQVGWRQSWTLFGCALALGLVPLLLWLLRGHPPRRPSDGSGPATTRIGPRHWSRAEVLRDLVFFLLLPAMLTPAFVVTGVFFNQTTLVEAKGWTLPLFASGYAVHALATVTATLGTGILVDRVSGLRLFPTVLMPLAAGLVCLACVDHPAAIFGFMALSGSTVGAFNVASSALLVELYGTSHLGAIRSLSVSLMVVSTAASPIVMGWLLDGGVGIETILLLCAAGIGLTTGLVPLALRRARRRLAP